MLLQDSLLYQKKLLPIQAGKLSVYIDAECRLYRLDPETELTSIVVPSTIPVQEGCLFIPYDEGDDYVREMVRKGAAAALTDHDIEGIPCIVTEDPYHALYCLARYLYEGIGLPAVVVAGSEGKTTTKRMVTAVLAQEYRVFSKAGNWNSMHSLTCSLQSIENGIDLLVQEVDEKRPDNPYCCSRILSPEIAVVTNVAESHIGYLGGARALAKSFCGITAGMDENGVLILNGDDENSLHAGFDARTLLVAIRNEKADCRAMNIDSGPEGTEFDVCFRGETVHVRLSAYGEHNVYDAMMAYVVGKLKGVSTEKILAGLKSYRNSGIRQNVCRVGGETVYADCYNASPTSIAFAVKAFCDLPGTTGRKVAVIGDIAEVDGYEEETYRRIAETVDTSDVDILVTYGGNSEMIWDYLTRPMAKRHARTAEELYDRLRSLRAEGENSYLFKASRVMKLEDAIRDVFPEHYREIKLSEKLY